jgi:hypothetical protein
VGADFHIIRLCRPARDTDIVLMKLGGGGGLFKQDDVAILFPIVLTDSAPWVRHEDRVQTSADEVPGHCFLGRRSCFSP